MSASRAFFQSMAVAPLHDPADEFEALYRDHARRVYRYALAVLRNPADAEDVTQTTFMNAYRAMQNGTEPEKPENWLIRIAHNACRTRFIRSANRPTEVPLDESVHDIPVPEQERVNVREVLRALGRLPFNQRSALVMRELEGRSYEEIADVLGVSVAAVETLLFRARRSMKLRRATIRSLGAVQLPGSLQTVFGGGAAVATGTAAGGGALLKAVALLTAAVTATGAGYEAVKASSARRPAHARAAQKVVLPEGGGRVQHPAPSAAAVRTPPAARRSDRSGAKSPKRRRVVTQTRVDGKATIATLPAASGGSPDAGTASAGGTTAPQAPAPAGGGASGDRPAAPSPVPVAAPVPVPVETPAVPATPALPPPPPVATPAVPTPPPVNVPQTPALPAVPPPPPLPKLP